jgi:hypothetical protein
MVFPYRCFPVLSIFVTFIVSTILAHVCPVFNIRFEYGARGSVVVKALCYKPEGRGFDTRRSDFLNLPNPSGRTKPWGLLSL